jgi:hypothetical protein
MIRFSVIIVVELIDGELSHIRHELLDRDTHTESLDKSGLGINSYNLSEVERLQSHPFLSRSDSLYLLYFSVFDSVLRHRLVL